VLSDVAREAGVSVPTVSRVLSGNIPVSDAKRERVLAAIERLNYRPNPAARALKLGRRSMIGVITFNTVRYGYSRTLQGIQEAARESGYLVLIAVVESDDRADMDAAVELLLGQSVAGLVVIEFDPVGVAISKSLSPGVPVVAAAAAGRSRSPHPHAFLDDRNAAREATNYLLSLGHETVHYLAIPQTDARTGRALGWRQALLDAGAPLHEPVAAAYDPASGYEGGSVLARDESVTAVLCGNDELAIGLMRALAEGGRRVPEDVSVIGFDDQPVAAMWMPALSTVHQDFVDLGRRVFGLLDTLITTGTSPQTSSAKPRLVLRESAAPPARRTPPTTAQVERA
jgi:DNA-binding LacI/PurR family transcriptional regulator